MLMPLWCCQEIMLVFICPDVELDLVNRTHLYSTNDEVWFRAVTRPSTRGLVQRYEWYLGVPGRDYPVYSSSSIYRFRYTEHYV